MKRGVEVFSHHQRGVVVFSAMKAPFQCKFRKFTSGEDPSTPGPPIYCREPPLKGLRGYGGGRTDKWRAQ